MEMRLREENALAWKTPFELVLVSVSLIGNQAKQEIVFNINLKMELPPPKEASFSSYICPGPMTAQKHQ